MDATEKILQILKKNIRYELKDTTSNHIKTILGFYHAEYCGELTDKEFKLWKQGAKSGGVYPVFHGKLSSEGELPKISLTIKVNRVSIGYLVVMCFLMVSLFFRPFDDYSSFSTTTILLKSLGASLVVGLAVFITVKSYRSQRKIEINRLKEIIHQAFPSEVQYEYVK